MKKSNRSGIEDMDTLVSMLKMASAFENWNKVMELADELLSLISFHEHDKRKGNSAKPAVFYYGYGHMMKGQALKQLRQYDDAITCIAVYAELDQLDLPSARDQAIAEYYRFIATAHLFAVRILSGHTEVLDDYILFLQEHPSEVRSGLTTIVKAAHKHKLNIDSVLQSFAAHIQEFSSLEGTADLAHYHEFLLELAQYQISRADKRSAIENILYILENTEEKGGYLHFKKCTALFEIIRDEATSAQKERYKSILQTIVEKEL